MPFDGTELTADSRRRLLIEALRVPLPPDVYWNFMIVSDQRGGRCGSVVCALGLAAIMWPEHEKVLLGGYYHIDKQAALFGIDRRAAERIFWGQHNQYANRRSVTVTRRLVADALENEAKPR